MNVNKKAAVIASKENPLTALVKEMEARGIETKLIYREDIKGYDAMEPVAEEIGSVDYLVISALQDKVLESKTIDQLTQEEYEDWKYYSLVQFYDINRTFVKRMVEAGGGIVFGVASEAAVTPAIHQMANGGAGAALVMGLKCLAEESNAEGIFTNAVAIGALEKNDDMAPMVLDDEMIKHLPAGHAIPEEQAVKKTVDLMTITDSAFTGNVISVDGAFSCAYMREW